MKEKNEGVEEWERGGRGGGRGCASINERKQPFVSKMKHMQADLNEYMVQTLNMKNTRKGASTRNMPIIDRFGSYPQKKYSNSCSLRLEISFKKN